MFRLTHANGLNEHHIEACGLTQQHGFSRFECHAAQRSTRWRGANEGVGVARQELHARFIAQNGTTRHGRAGIDGQHSDFMAFRDEMLPECLDKRRFTDAGNASYADA